MSNLNKLDALKSYIQKISAQVFQSQELETIVSGVIKESSPGKYLVQFAKGADADFVFAVAIGDAVYNEGDNVYLVKPKYLSGDKATTDFLIYGTVSAVDIAYKNASAYERFVSQFSDELSDKEGIAINYTGTDTHNQKINLNFSKELIDNILITGIIDVSGIFTHLSGDKDYGLKLVFKDENETILDEFFLNTAYFEGQPYKLNNVKQHRFVQLQWDLEKRSKVKTIELYAFSKGSSFTVNEIKVESGTVLRSADSFSLKLFTQDNKDYLLNSEDSLSVVVEAYFEKQKISTGLLKYFWFIKDDSITEDYSETESVESVNVVHAYHPLCGAGWRCLTSFNYGQVYVNNAIEVDKEIKIWNAQNNIFEFNRDILTNFENIVKCVAVYQGNGIESEEFKIINWEKEDVSMTLVADTETLILFNDNDKITLTCSAISNNIIAASDYIYKWYYTTSDGVELELKDASGNAFEVSKYFLGEEGSPFLSGKIDFTCKIYNQIDGENEQLLAPSTDSEKVSISITSKIEDFYNAQTRQSTNYRIWLSEYEGKVFKSEKISESLDGENISYIKWNPNSPLAETAFNPNDNAELLTFIKQNNFAQCYVYCSTQTMYSKANIIFNKSDWSKPTVVRYVKREGNGLRDLYDDNVLSQLNTFNNLTNNGSEEGFYFDEDQEAGTRKMYINATYIRTGAFEVQDKETKQTLFRAGWDKDNNDNPIVLIGGYTVGETELSSQDGKVGISSSTANDNVAFWAGRPQNKEKTDSPFYVTHDGELHTTSGTIGGFHITGNHLADGDIEDPKVTNHNVLISGTGVSGSGDAPFEDGNFVFWAGEGETGGDKPFWIKKDGSFYANKGTFSGSLVVTQFFDENKNGTTNRTSRSIEISSGSNGIGIYSAGKTDDNKSKKELSITENVFKIIDRSAENIQQTFISPNSIQLSGSGATVWLSGAKALSLHERYQDIDSQPAVEKSALVVDCDILRLGESTESPHNQNKIGRETHIFNKIFLNSAIQIGKMDRKNGQLPDAKSFIPKITITQEGSENPVSININNQPYISFVTIKLTWEDDISTVDGIIKITDDDEVILYYKNLSSSSKKDSFSCDKVQTGNLNNFSQILGVQVMGRNPSLTATSDNVLADNNYDNQLCAYFDTESENKAVYIGIDNETKYKGFYILVYGT